MKVELDLSGIKELLEELESCATDAEIKKANKRIVNRSTPIVKGAMQKHIPVSPDHSKSGKKGYRTSEHAKQVVPIGAIHTKGTTAWADVGWTLQDNSEYFYMKFVEWGTWRMPPKDFIEVAVKETERKITEIARQEYEELLAKKLGG